jgi:hypothetical protein
MFCFIHANYVNFDVIGAFSARYYGQTMGDSSYRLNFDQGKKNEIQHHS